MSKLRSTGFASVTSHLATSAELSFMECEPIKAVPNTISEILIRIKVSNDRKLKRGVVLKVETSNSKSWDLKFNHFGIYAGNNEVIHFKESGIEKVKISQFVSGKETCEVMGFEKNLKYTTEDSYFRANLKLTENNGKYSVIQNNCEHFALWCRTGEAISTQTGGTKSEEYDLVSSSNFIPLIILNVNIPNWISEIYCLKFGMKKSRTIDIRKIEDVNLES